MDKPTAMEINTPEDPDLNCRLRNGLNPDCLAIIFEYLPVRDLIKLSQMNDHYKQIIYNFVIHKKESILFGNTLYADVIDAKTEEYLIINFGDRLKRLRFFGDIYEFHKFYNSIVCHFPKEQITDIEVTIGYSNGEFESCFGNMSYQPMLSQADGHFLNLKKLQIKCLNDHEYEHTAINKVLSLVLADAPNLKSLKLSELYVNNNRLSSLLIEGTMLNLTELHLEEVSIDLQFLIEFIQKRPNLQQFVVENGLPNEQIEILGNVLATYCGNTLHTFCNITADTWIGETIEDNIMHANRYKFLSKFKHLKNVTITSNCACASDMYYPIIELAKRNTVEKLEIYQNFFMNEALFPENQMNIVPRILDKLTEVTMIVDGHQSMFVQDDQFVEQLTLRHNVKCKKIVN